MSPNLIRQLNRYRSLSVAVANAIITWVILIIAPLGLFAVIVCTVLIFFSSLIFGLLGDIAMALMLRDSNPPAMAGGRPPAAGGGGRGRRPRDYGQDDNDPL